MTAHGIVGAAHAFLQAVELSSDVLRNEATRDAWSSASALPQMAVGDVAGHLFLVVRRALQVVETAGRSVDDPETRLGDWYGSGRIDSPADLLSPAHSTVRDDGRHVGARGWDNVNARYAAVCSSLRQRLPAASDDSVVSLRPRVDISLTLRDYLATRTVEVLVHTDDLALSTGQADIDPPYEAVELAIWALTQVTLQRRGLLATLRAMTRSDRSDTSILRVF